MKKITIDVQLAPCEAGVDIFLPTEKLIKIQGCRYYQDESEGTRSVAMYKDEFPDLALITKPVKATLTIEAPREEGFYWVNRHLNGEDSGWVVRYWNGVNFSDGKGSEWGEHVYTTIDERKIERLPE